MAISILENCTGCGTCIAACRFDALTLKTEYPDGFGEKKAVVTVHLCCDCGECNPGCRYQAIKTL